MTTLIFHCDVKGQLLLKKVSSINPGQLRIKNDAESAYAIAFTYQKLDLKLEIGTSYDVPSDDLTEGFEPLTVISGGYDDSITINLSFNFEFHNK